MHLNIKLRAVLALAISKETYFPIFRARKFSAASAEV
jgi:hypothetical protein